MWVLINISKNHGKDQTKSNLVKPDKFIVFYYESYDKEEKMKLTHKEQKKIRKKKYKSQSK